MLLKQHCDNKSSHGGDVTAVSVGEHNAKEALKHALAMGCSEAIQITDAALSGADSLVVSHVLADCSSKNRRCRCCILW